MGLSHSGTSDDSYGDTTGYMGRSVLGAGTPHRCYNAAQHWQLGWYDESQRVSIVDASSSPSSQLIYVAAFVDAHKTIDDPATAVLVQLDDSRYLQFNRAKDYNAGTGQMADLIVITQLTSSGTTRLLAGLDMANNPVYQFGSGVTVEVCDVVIGDAAMADYDFAVISAGTGSSLCGSYTRQPPQGDNDDESDPVPTVPVPWSSLTASPTAAPTIHLPPPISVPKPIAPTPYTPQTPQPTTLVPTPVTLHPTRPVSSQQTPPEPSPQPTRPMWYNTPNKPDVVQPPFGRPWNNHNDGTASPTVGGDGDSDESSSSSDGEPPSSGNERGARLTIGILVPVFLLLLMAFAMALLYFIIIRQRRKKWAGMISLCDDGDSYNLDDTSVGSSTTRLDGAGCTPDKEAMSNDEYYDYDPYTPSTQRTLSHSSFPSVPSPPLPQATNAEDESSSFSRLLYEETQQEDIERAVRLILQQDRDESYDLSFREDDSLNRPDEAAAVCDPFVATD